MATPKKKTVSPTHKLLVFLYLDALLVQGNDNAILYGLLEEMSCLPSRVYFPQSINNYRNSLWEENTKVQDVPVYEGKHNWNMNGLARFRLTRELTMDVVLSAEVARVLANNRFKGNLFAAAAHSGKTDLINSVNRIRLKTRHDYYNSGVLLIDLAAGRSRIDPQALFAYAAEHVSELWLPDQDLLNALFGEQILPLEDVLWNYDARDYQGYLLASGGQYDNDWVVRHTVVLHFCGRSKPWKKNYPYRFGLLYKHYEKLTDQLLARLDRGENRP